MGESGETMRSVTPGLDSLYEFSVSFSLVFHFPVPPALRFGSIGFHGCSCLGIIFGHEWSLWG